MEWSIKYSIVAFFVEAVITSVVVITTIVPVVVIAVAVAVVVIVVVDIDVFRVGLNVYQVN